MQMHRTRKQTMTTRRHFMDVSTHLALAVALAGSAAAALAQTAPAKPPVTLLNVSDATTREFYLAYNAAFTKYGQARTGRDVTLKQSHGGWAKADKEHFSDGASFDQIYVRK